MSEKELCKQQVTPREPFGSFHRCQCQRSVWKDGYCKQHHPDTVKQREEEREKRWEKKREQEKQFYLNRNKAIIDAALPALIAECAADYVIALASGKIDTNLVGNWIANWRPKGQHENQG